ncbi:N-acetylhexosaminidase [Punctularia strigosozonata HHB-11173 SS5]|uniref:N-acetylhexosaminidase n=1 Tax=Punctularia strigosozonata (strain HHB-11173) TaxID=741275 RepID=UPI00044166F7|nr:N-acetylhexosaminidase [Punctularia strigosozonata HHB-11173 SS5]EIN12327.1 N-acetylhexosaminidase [Punctularia strigosozonata HHB-11173 SS5]
MLVQHRLVVAVTCVPVIVNAIWPLPTTIKTGRNVLRLADEFSIQITFPNPPTDLVDAVSRTEHYVKSDHLGRLVVDRGQSDLGVLEEAMQLTTLRVELVDGAPQIRSISEEATRDISERNEAYSLDIPSTGGPAMLSANTSLGLFRGLATFSQLWYTVDNIIYNLEAPVSIDDVPELPYRGFMLDTSRHFFPVSDIKRTLDAMSWVKMSQLYWHVVDSQSFPLQIPGFEEVSRDGAYSNSSVYTPSDVAQIVSYAATRGIDVVPEIDTPGHTAVISESHPEHVACPQATPWASFASEPPAGQLRLASPSTMNFTTNLLSAAAKLYSSRLFSTGGDEVNTNCYDQDDETQIELKATGQTLEQALGVFTLQNHAALEKLGKTPIVKEEILLDYDVPLSNETIVVVWISSQNATSVAERGYRLIHQPSDYFYLDCGAGGWVGSDPSGNSWCDPFKTWQRAYTFDPYANMTETQRKLVIGGQQPLWTEQASPTNLDSIVWPRAAASAELFWSGPSKTNVTSALPRLHELASRMSQRGVKAIPLQPTWCALRPYACDLAA